MLIRWMDGWIYTHVCICIYIYVYMHTHIYIQSTWKARVISLKRRNKKRTSEEDSRRIYVYRLIDRYIYSVDGWMDIHACVCIYVQMRLALAKSRWLFAERAVCEFSRA